MSRSHLTGFGLSMTVKAIKLEEIRVFRRLAPTIGFLAGLAPATVAPMAHAQVNIDQGMPPAQIFANDCATCHKSVRGLAVGKNSLMLTGFLREHYTASNEQAAALAAYVLGAGGSEPAPQEPKRKPESEHAKATGEEPKTGEAKTGEAKIEEPKTAAHPSAASVKPEEEAPASAKLQPSTDEETKREERANPAAAGKHEAQPVTAKPEEAAPVTANPAINETPGSAEAPSQEFGPTTSAANPIAPQPGETAPVPRDHIPD